MESVATSSRKRDFLETHQAIDDLKIGEISTEDMRDIIQKLEQVRFFESLTNEATGKIKDIAQELIDFRQDLQNKIEPGIVEMAAKDIPEASNQLEGINETLEKSTMKIMDINDEQLDLSQRQLHQLKSGNANDSEEPGKVSDIIAEQMEALEKINRLSMDMLEPLNFQDLVGQRIQRIIKLVKTMEVRIEDLIISFGIKIQKHKEDPTKSFDELQIEEENFRSELQGPQRDGDGLGQGDIDALLASL